MHEFRSPRPYATAARQPGELSLSEAAQRLKIHPQTARRYARDAVAFAEAAATGVDAKPSRLPEARRDNLGRYWVPERAIKAFRAADPDALDQVQ